MALMLFLLVTQINSDDFSLQQYTGRAQYVTLNHTEKKATSVMECEPTQLVCLYMFCLSCIVRTLYRFANGHTERQNRMRIIVTVYHTNENITVKENVIKSYWQRGTQFIYIFSLLTNHTKQVLYPMVSNKMS